MGGDHSSMSYNRVPNAIVVFGPTKDNGTALENLKETLITLDDIISKLNNAVQSGSKYIEFFAVVSPYTGYVAKFFSIVNNLIAESVVLNKALNDLEQNIYSTLLDGKLLALKNHIATMQDVRTSVEQKKMELVSAVNHFHEILPIFTKSDSILHRKYYIGAQLFVPFCGLLKMIIVIANNTPNYNNAGLENLKQIYQSVLQSFKYRCIRQRLKYIHISCISTSQYDNNTRHFYEEGLQKFSEYFGSTTSK